jgi:hypothetical protein
MGYNNNMKPMTTPRWHAWERCCRLRRDAGVCLGFGAGLGRVSLASKQV